MKLYLSLILLLIFSFSAFGQSIEERIKTFKDKDRYETNYDKFKDKTRVTFDSFNIYDERTKGYAIKFGLSYFFKGQDAKDVVDVFLLQ